MTAQVIDISAGRTQRHTGNGAREALIEVGIEMPNTSAQDAACWADWLLAEFWSRGFKVVPLDL